MTQILCVAGARPNFMKIAPVMAALAETGIAAQLLHTGQHYDAAMSDSFFADLGIPRPDHHLEVGSGSHAVQTAEVMKRFEPVLESVQPRAVLVVGDVNSTIACALVAAKRGEAIEFSPDRSIIQAQSHEYPNQAGAVVRRRGAGGTAWAPRSRGREHDE